MGVGGRDAGRVSPDLPPDTYPLGHARRPDQVRWREKALADAQRELSRAKRARLLRRIIALGLRGQ